MIAEAAGSLRTKDDDLFFEIYNKLPSAYDRARPHVPAMVEALEALAAKGGKELRCAKIAELIDRIGGPLGPHDAGVVLRSGGPAWPARARAARGTGDTHLDLLRDLLDGTEVDKLSAAGAAILLGPVAEPLLAKLEPRIGPPPARVRDNETYHSERATASLAAAVAVVAIDPSRAGEHEPFLRLAIRSSLTELGASTVTEHGAERDETPALWPFLSSLPDGVQASLAGDIAELPNWATDTHLDMLVALGSLSGAPRGTPLE